MPVETRDIMKVWTAQISAKVVGPVLDGDNSAFVQK